MRAASRFTAETVRETLRLTRLWAPASESILARASERVHLRQFVDGELLIRQGQRCDATHVLVEGQVDIRVLADDGTESTICTLGEGESIGEMSLLTGEPASANVLALGSVATLAIDAADFTEVVTADPSLLHQVVRILSRRLSQTDVEVGVARGKEQDLTHLLEEAEGFADDVIGSSAPVRLLRKRLGALAPGSAPVLVRGERGTRRSSVARLLHKRSDRRMAPVIGVNCHEVVETPFGDPIFSAPGARATKGSALCYLELAEGGTLILKDLERLPPAAQQRLVAYLGEHHPQFDVRILATAPDATGGEQGRISEELLACFGDRVLVVPPLRERKRDIPLLAQEAATRHAQRLGKPGGELTDESVTKLVSYDYRIGNDRELEEAIERAVILGEETTIEAETLFLGPPPPPRSGALNLLALPGVDVRRAARVLPQFARVASVLFFAFILVLAFFGPSHEAGNPATILVWALWWPALVLSFFLAGRLWCGLCPMGLATTLGDRLPTKKLRIPGWLKKHDVRLAMAGLLLIVLVEETTGMRHSPLATGLLLLTILLGATVTGALLPRRTWCRHLCPLGGMAGACATSGLLELRPTYDVCAAKCKGHACYKGDEKTAGCPMFNHVMFVDTNQHCVMCMNCVQSCPNGSPQLNLRLPGRELWSGSGAGAGLGAWVLLLLGILLGLATVQYLERIGHPAVHGGARPLWVGLLVLGAAALPWLVTRPFRVRAARRGEPGLEAFWRQVGAWTPWVTAGLVAYHIEYLPGLASIEGSLHSTQAGASAPWLTIELLTVLRGVVLLGGLLVTLVLLGRAHREAPELEPSERRRLRGLGLGGLAAYAVVLVALFLGG